MLIYFSEGSLKYYTFSLIRKKKVEIYKESMIWAKIFDHSSQLLLYDRHDKKHVNTLFKLIKSIFLISENIE